MPTDKIISFYLEEPLRKSAQAGEHNFINLMAAVVKRSGLEPVFLPSSNHDHSVSGYSLSHMTSPPNDKGLVFRRVYHYPFWQIEAVSQRWHWDVARASFDPINASDDAARFYRFWQKRLFGDAPQRASKRGLVYVPLQGQLLRKRIFQSCTPLEMVQHCLTHDANRQIVVTLHPKETYRSDELAGLEALSREHARLTIDIGNMEKYLQTCDYVVTQNSSAAFSGYFFGKPTLLFGQVDFHHIAERANMLSLRESFERVAALKPAFAAYIWWFWQDQSINAGRDDAKTKIAARLRRFGWPISEE
ncbi:MAG: hypothetical protein ABJL67_18105 [Sulfitobacter sp.]